VRRQPPVDRGKTSLMVLIDQLDLLAATMDKVFDAVCRADAAALVAHGLFLAQKFGTASTGGGAVAAVRTSPSPRMSRARAAAASRDGYAVTIGPKTRTLTLDQALDALAGVAERGRCAGRGRASRGCALAAAVAESAPGAAATGCRRSGRDHPGLLRRRQRGSTMAGGSHGDLSALWRRAPRTASLMRRRSLEVVSAACDLGEPTMRVIGNASVRSAAQLTAAGARTSSCRT
jgi:hypothetical protein